MLSVGTGEPLFFLSIEKVLISDGRRAIVGSCNWLSFNPRPGQGVRRERGILVDDREDVSRLRAELAGILGLR